MFLHFLLVFSHFPFLFSHFSFLFSHFSFVFTHFPFLFTRVPSLPFEFSHFSFVFTHVPFVFTRVPFGFHSCSLFPIRVHLFLIRVPFVFCISHQCSLVFHPCSHLCGVLDLIVLNIIKSNLKRITFVRTCQTRQQSHNYLSLFGLCNL